MNDDQVMAALSEMLRSDEAEEALTHGMSNHVYGHQRSNNPRYFGCDGRCASTAALHIIERYLRDNFKVPSDGNEDAV